MQILPNPQRAAGLRGRRSPGRPFARAWLALLLTGLPAAAAEPAGAESPPVRVREILVPEADFLRLAGQSPEGVVMRLAEYRELVIAAYRRRRIVEPVRLPPVAAVATTAEHSARLHDSACRVDSVLDIRVAAPGWVACDLGPALPRPGRVLVDGEPGWIVTATTPPAPPPPAGAATATRQAEAAAGKEAAPRHFLLLRGLGRHRVEIGSTLLAAEAKDEWTLDGSLPVATAARLRLEVPGSCEGTSPSGPLETEHLEATGVTRFTLGPGRDGRFRVVWRLRRSGGESASLIDADHRLALLPRRSEPIFVWETTAEVSRRAVQELVFVEPPGLSVAEVKGELLHSWQRDGRRIRLLLSAPHTGRLVARFEGFLRAESTGGEGDRTLRFEVGCPRLEGAFANRVHVGLLSPAPDVLELDGVEGGAEISVAEAEVPELSGAPLARAVTFPSPAGSLTLATRERAARFEYRGAGLVRVLERSMQLTAEYGLRVTNGRLYRLEMSLPAPWSLEQLTALRGPKAEVDAAFSHEVVDRNGARTIRLEFRRAVAAGEAVRLVSTLRHSFGASREWSQREVEFRVPTLSPAEGAGLDRAQVDLGIALSSSIDATTITQTGWLGLGRPELKAVGVVDEAVVAGLSSTRPDRPIRLSLRHRETRGELQSVIHLLALDGTTRVRTDLRLAVVDRAVDAIRLALPIARDVHVHVVGEGAQETDREDRAEGGSVRTIRFDKPWMGTRQLRLEYETAQPTDTGVPIPTVAVLGDFTASHSIVFQSLGPVELEVSPGPGLEAIEVDDLPDFATPWKGARLLFAYRLRALGAPGDHVLRVHPPAPVLDSMGRELMLTTVIDRTGVSRTRAEVHLGYDERQYLDVELPPDSRLLEVEVDGRLSPTDSVKRGAIPGSWSIRLPTRTHSEIAIVYERPSKLEDGVERPPEADGLAGTWGRWSESGPRFDGVPVERTVWRLYHPEGYRFDVTGGNLTELSSGAGAPPPHFAAAVFGRLLRGELPRLTTFERHTPLRPFTRLTDVGLAAPTIRTEDPGAAQLLQSVQAIRHDDVEAPATRLVMVVPHGRGIELSKVGGDPVVRLAYRSFDWWRLATATVFTITLLTGLWVAARRGRSAFFRLVGLGLIYGTIVPPVLSGVWESPFLVLPFCEGLVVLLLGSVVYLPLAAAVRSLRRRRRSALAPGAALSAGLLVAALGAVTVNAAEGSTGVEPADETIIVPYDPDRPGGLSPDELKELKVLVPDEAFERLRRLARPDEPPPPEAPPVPDVVGNIRYELTVDESTYRMTGSVDWNVLTDEWATLELPFEHAQLVRVLLDGAEIGVLREEDRVRIAVRDPGQHRVDLELTGPVLREPGVSWVAANLLTGSATRLVARLPAGAEVLGARKAGCVVDAGAEATRVEIDLGSADRLDLRWHFPGISGQSASQIESLSYSLLELTVDGYRLSREERVTVKGQPTETLKYRILGGLQVLDVVAPELSEWGVEEEDGTRSLVIYFSRPVESSALRVRGWAELAGDARPVGGLHLPSAVRQESYFALAHGARRRWGADVLAAARRASVGEASRLFGAKTVGAPDRVYHLHQSGDGQSVVAEVSSGDLELSTDCVLVVSANRILISGRTRFRLTGLGPFRAEITLPAGWEPRAVKGEAVRSWSDVSDATATRIAAHLTRRARAGDEVVWSAEREYEGSVPSEITVPRPQIATFDQTARREIHVWTIAADEALTVSDTTERRGLRPLPQDQWRTWVELPRQHRYRFAYRSTGSTPDYALRLIVERPEGRIAATSVLFARLTELHTHVNARLLFSMGDAGVDRFRFRLPAGSEQVAIESANQKTRSITDAPDGGRDVEVVLISPARGEHIIDVAYRIPRDPEATSVPIRPIEIFDGDRAPDDWRQYVGLVQNADSVVVAERTEQLEALELDQFPLLPDGVDPTGLKPTFRARASGWRLEAREEPLGTRAELTGRIELAEISTVLADDGTLRSRAVFTLRNRQLQFLEVRLPDDAALWGVTLAGRAVQASQVEAPDGASVLQIPLEHVGRSDLDLEVGVVYSQDPVDMPTLWSSLRLEAPRVSGLKVKTTLWRVDLPASYDVEFRDGNVKPVTGSIRHASKVENLLRQIDDMERAYEQAESARLMRSAADNLTQLEQALTDEVMDLERETGVEVRQEGARDGGEDLGEETFRQQLGESLRSLERGRSRKARLEERRKGEEEREERGPGWGRQEMMFRNGWNFLRNGWQEGEGAPGGDDPEAATTRPPSDGETLTLDELRESRFFDGLQAAGGTTTEPAVVRSTARAIAEAGGLPDLPTRLTSPVQPATETPPEGEQRRSLTFRREAGDATLELSLSRRGATGRTAALVLTLAVVAAHAALWRRRRRGAAGSAVEADADGAVS